MKTTFTDKLAARLREWSLQDGEGLPDTLVPELKGAETRQALAEVIIALLNRWELHIDNQGELLGITDMGRILQERQLPDDVELLQRMGHLLAIERALKNLYPYAPTDRDRWVWKPNEYFTGKSPLQIMLEEGVSGIRRVRKGIESELESRRIG
jgi:hypothetical protein